MSLAFKGRHFAPDIILLCMRWYCRYALTYRALKEMMAERHLSVDHTTIYRWVQHFAPELDRRIQWCNPLQTKTWYVDETNVRSEASGCISTGRSATVVKRWTSTSRKPARRRRPNNS